MSLEKAIAVPDMNSSDSPVVLDGTQYIIRFEWNDFAKRWKFGLYTIQKEPLVQGQWIVPRFPLNLQIVSENFPNGIFGAKTDLSSVGRHDFVNGLAKFVYIPAGGDGSA